MYRYEDKIRELLQVAHTSGQEAMAYCPFHDNSRSPALQINLESGLWVCFVCTNDKGGHLGGGMKTLARLLGLAYTEPEVEAKEVLKALDALDAPVVVHEPMKESALTMFRILPTHYWQERGFTPATVDEWELGYDPRKEAAIIPARNFSGELMGVIYRYLSGDVKYMYPKGFPRKHELFGAYRVTDKRIALCEGSLDAIRTWQNGLQAVAQFGSSLSDEQATLIYQMGVEEVILLHDNDKAGHKAASQAAEMLSGMLTYRPKFPAGIKDPGDLTQQGLRRMLRRLPLFAG